MLAFLIVVASAAFGWGAVRRLGWPLGRVEQLALAAAFALTAPPWVLFLAAWALGFAAGLPTAVAVLALAGWALGRGRRAELAAGPRPSWLSWIALGVLFALLFHGHMLHAEATGLWSGGSTYSDLALHATLVSHFSYTEVAFDSPIAAGEPLTYPFLGDFHVACLVRGGWSMSTAFAVTGWLCAMTGFALVDALARRLFHSRAAGTIAVWLIVLSGAVVGLWYAGADLAASGLPADAASMPSYANMWDRGVTWSNLVCDFLLPQRAFLAAFPVLWAAMLLLRSAVDEAGSDRGARRRLLVAVGLLVGALPLFHVHSFLIAMGMVALAATWAGVAGGGGRTAWWLVLAAALALAAPQLAWQLAGSWSSEFGHWHPGWRAPRGEFWIYWLRNWGLPLLLVPVAVATAVRIARRGCGSFALLMMIGATGTFTAANLYQFQPHEWDNMKLFVYAHMGVAVILAGGLARWLALGGVRRPLAVLAIVAMTGTGVLTLVRELDKHDQLTTTSDLELAARLRSVLPANARVLTSDQHNHLVPMLTGRRIVMGYRGWLWTHGIKSGPIERDVRAMFAGGAGTARLFRKRSITHVYIGPGERRDYGAKPEWYRDRYVRVLAAHGVEVFDVRMPLNPLVART